MHHLTTEALNELLRQQRELCRVYYNANESILLAPYPPLPSEDDSVDADEMRKALHCLRLEVDATIVDFYLGQWEFFTDYHKTRHQP